MLRRHLRTIHSKEQPNRNATTMAIAPPSAQNRHGNRQKEKHIGLLLVSEEKEFRISKKENLARNIDEFPQTMARNTIEMNDMKSNESLLLFLSKIPHSINRYDLR